MSSSSHIIKVAIVGAQKSGTTSLLKYLGQHPKIQGQEDKEFSFFTEEKLYKLGLDYNIKRSFGDLNSKDLLIKQVELSQSLIGLERLKNHNPKVKLIFIVRNPVDRFYSSYNMQVSSGYIQESLSSVLSKIENGENHLYKKMFVTRSDYTKALRNIYTYFPKEQLKILLFEDLKKNPAKVVSEVISYLNHSEFKLQDTEIYNKTKQSSKLLSHLLHLIKLESNPLKRLVRKILPIKIYRNMGKRISDIPLKDKIFDELSSENRLRINKLVGKIVDETEQLSGIDLGIWRE